MPHNLSHKHLANTFFIFFVCVRLLSIDAHNVRGSIHLSARLSVWPHRSPRPSSHKWPRRRTRATLMSCSLGRRSIWLLPPTKSQWPWLLRCYRGWMTIWCRLCRTSSSFLITGPSKVWPVADIPAWALSLLISLKTNWNWNLHILIKFENMNLSCRCLVKNGSKNHIFSWKIRMKNQDKLKVKFTHYDKIWEYESIK